MNPPVPDAKAEKAALDNFNPLAGKWIIDALRAAYAADAGLAALIAENEHHKARCQEAIEISLHVIAEKTDLSAGVQELQGQVERLQQLSKEGEPLVVAVHARLSRAHPTFGDVLNFAGSGVLYVMNEAGRTIARYEL